MKRHILLVAIVTAMTLISRHPASAYTITDNYIGKGNPYDGGYDQYDVIGNTSIFGIDKMTVNTSGNTMSVAIFTNYVNNIGDSGTGLGDLFISTNGWHPYGTAPYMNDNYQNGEHWEYALAMNSNGSLSLYQVAANNSNIKLTDSFIDHNRYYFRAGQEARIDTTQTNYLVSNSSVGSWAINGAAKTLTYSFDLSNFDPSKDFSTSTWGFIWDMTCGNDVIEGAAPAPVPEPSTFILLTAGLLGAVFYRMKLRRR